MKLQVWNLHLVTRLHRFSLNPDASFLIWRKDILVVAPLYTGVVQVAGRRIVFSLVLNMNGRLGDLESITNSTNLPINTTSLQELAHKQHPGV